MLFYFHPQSITAVRLSHLPLINITGISSPRPASLCRKRDIWLSFPVRSRFAGSLGNLNSATAETESACVLSPARPGYSPALPSSPYPSQPPDRTPSELNNNRGSNLNLPGTTNESYGWFRPSYPGLSTSAARYLSRSIPVSARAPMPGWNLSTLQPKTTYSFKQAG
ncbi:hypothetical protein FKM82_020511 [Ascaphus truei]